MNSREFYNTIANSTAHRLIREKQAAFVLENPKYFADLFALALDTKDKNHYKACWILEIVHETNPYWIESDVGVFCNNLPLFQQDGAVRSISKICMHLAKAHSKSIKKHDATLSPAQLQQITEACFDWVISDTKVASKVYAIRALFEIGKTNKWIYPELKAILLKDFHLHSAAYQSAAKEILKKIE